MEEKEKLRGELITFLTWLDSHHAEYDSDGIVKWVGLYLKNRDGLTEEEIKINRPNINQYPITDSRTFLKDDGTIDYDKYIKALDKYIDWLLLT